MFGFNKKTKEIYYQSVEGSSTERGIYSVKLSGKGKRVLHKTRGTNGATFSVGFHQYVFVWIDARHRPWWRGMLPEEN